MSTSFRELQPAELTDALKEWLLPQLQKILTSRAPGHCMRVADLDWDLMLSLCQSLRESLVDTQVFILADQQQGSDYPDLFVSATKLVELRNPLPDGSLGSPLLVFLPPNLQTSAEDSFGVATFEEIDVSNIYRGLAETLLLQVPSALQGYTQAILKHLITIRWAWADEVAQVRYLLTAIRNGIDGTSLGAALFELGLVPDFKLFNDPAIAINRISRNHESVHKLTYSDLSIRGRAMELGLSDKTFQRRLTQFLIEAGLDNPQAWTRQIVLNAPNWGLSFDKWQFETEIRTDKVLVEVMSIDLPVVPETESDERLQGLIGQQILLPQDRRKFSVTFSCDPHPSQVQGLHHFSVQILTKDGTPVGVVKTPKAWSSKKLACTVSLDKLNKVDWEEGWHFIRILAWTEDNDPIPVVDPRKESDDSLLAPNESEPFYVLPEGDFEEEASQRSFPQEHSLEYARLQLQFAAILEGRDPEAIRLESVGWSNGNKRTRQSPQELLEVKFGRNGIFHIPVARHLRHIEQRILSSPSSPVSWRLQINNRQIEMPIPDILELPKLTAVESFLAARSKYFESILGSEKELISQAADFLNLKDISSEYAAAYQDLLLDLKIKIERSTGADQQRAIAALRTVLLLDTIHLVLTDFRGKVREAILIGPIHPLRALWLTSWAQVAQSWLLEAKKGGTEYAAPVRDALLQTITLSNVPSTLPLSDGRVFAAIDNIHPFWSLYAPANVEDPRGLLAEVCTVFDLPEPNIGGSSITGGVLASRITRYLVQHPYIRTLCINLFNPGQASVLASALVSLQKQQAFSQLRYDIRLFVSDSEAPGVGEALEQLLSPTGTTSSDADAFSISSGNHLFPKLSLSIHSIDDFRATPDTYRAHLSLLLDLFPAAAISTGEATRPTDVASLHGLIQDFDIQYHDDETGTYWLRQPRHGEATHLTNKDVHLIDLLASLPKTLSGAVSTIALNAPAFEQRPQITLGLDADKRELIHYVHGVSDWVFTIDRNLGIEFFDHGGKSDRPDYLVDYIPSALTGSSYQIVITSRSLSELEALLYKVLDRYGSRIERPQTSLILEQLRLLSSRLALKLLSSSTQQAEVLGLALARLFLKYQGALSNQIVLPLDAHLELFQSSKKYAEAVGNEVTLQRTDLALFELNASSRTVTCNLVEVKCHTVGSLNAYNQLRDKIVQQINRSEEVLREYFDPNWKCPDRPDRLLLTRQFATLLKFYLDRTVRYGLIDQQAAEEADVLLTTLEEGYTLEFTRSALIFDFDKPGTEPPEKEFGIEFHRVGIDLIRALIAETTEPESDDSTGKSSNSEDSIPRLESAAFIRPKRSHLVTWESYSQSKRTSSIEINEQTEGTKIDSFSTVPSPVESPSEETSSNSQSVEQPQALSESPTVPVPEERVVPDQIPQIPVQLEVPLASTLSYDIILGTQTGSPQYGILGESSGHKIALDLNQTHTISLFGVQGAGKSYTLGSIVEMACLPAPGINVLPKPLATVIFHYSPTQDYKPEFTSMVQPNSEQDQVLALRERYHAKPTCLEDVVILVPKSKVDERKVEYPDIQVLPITFAASELKSSHWKFLMGAVGSQSMYLRQINLILRKLRDNLTYASLVTAVEESGLADHLKDLAKTRLEFAAEYIEDSQKLVDIIRPGRLVIVDLRDEFIEKDEALGLFVVMLQIFSEATYQESLFNKLVVFDEAHKYIESPDLVAGLIEIVREMRHKGTSIMVASQDPPSVPTSLIELSSQIILHRFNSPAWLKHIQKANAALDNLTPEKMSQLGPGEAYIWSGKSSEDSFVKGALKVRLRPRLTQHGGSTRTAV
ncbi:hypothetical protein NDI52_11845 [Leptolyngbya sp. PL-A3]